MAIDVVGLACPFDVPTRLHEDAYDTRFQRGAFAASIAQRKSDCRIEAWVGHRRHTTIARRCDGDLGLSETADGLMFLMKVDHPMWASIIRDTAALGQLHGVSIAWKPDTVRAQWEGDVRVITVAELIELSLVTFKMRPQFPGTWARVVDAARAA